LGTLALGCFKKVSGLSRTGQRVWHVLVHSARKSI